MAVAELWGRSRYLLEEWDGAATEIFVTNLPLSNLARVIDVALSLPDIQLTAFESFDFNKPLAVDTSWRLRLIKRPDKSCQHSFVAGQGTPQHLQIYLWLDPDGASIDVELVFWSDMTFPTELSEQEKLDRFEHLVCLSETFRQHVRSSQCILTAEHNDSIEELLKQTHIFVW